MFLASGLIGELATNVLLCYHIDNNVDLYLQKIVFPNYCDKGCVKSQYPTCKIVIVEVTQRPVRLTTYTLVVVKNEQTSYKYTREIMTRYTIYRIEIA